MGTLEFQGKGVSSEPPPAMEGDEGNDILRGQAGDEHDPGGDQESVAMYGDDKLNGGTGDETIPDPIAVTAAGARQDSKGNR